MSNDPNPDVVGYIAQHRDAYTREAIDARLRAAGHSPEAIEAAWQAVAAREAPPQATSPPADEPNQLAHEASQPTGEARRPASSAQPTTPPGAALTRSPRFWATLIGFVLAVYAMPFIFAGAIPDSGDAIGVGVMVAFVLWLAGLVGAIVLARRRPVLARGLLFGFAAVFLIPFIGLVIVAGICIVALSQQGLS